MGIAERNNSSGEFQFEIELLESVMLAFNILEHISTSITNPFKWIPFGN
jgi:hypothetical protein